MLNRTPLRAALLAATLALAAPAGAQQAPDTASTLSDRQLRQLATYAETDAAALEREAAQLRVRSGAIRAELTRRIARDSAATMPEPTPPRPDGTPLPPAPDTAASHPPVPADTAQLPPLEPAPVSGPAPAFTDGFESGALAAAPASGFRWRRPSAKSGSSVAVSRDIAHSGSHSLKFLYGASPRPCDDGWAEQRFELGENLKEVWFEYYIYLPRGTEGLGPRFVHRQNYGKAGTGCASTPDVVDNNKFFALWDTKYNDIDVMVLVEYRRSKSGADGDSRLYNMWGSTGGGVVATRNRAEGGGTWDGFVTDATRGRWVQVRIHVRLADSIEAANGVVELWFDGVKRINDTGLTLVSTDPDARNFFRNGYIMGWANSGFNEATSMYVDDFRVYASDPGWR